MIDNEKKVLEEVQSQISSFDNKASILLSVVGIFFALTLSFVDVFHSQFFLDKIDVYKICFSIFFVSYIIITIFVMLAFVLVIIPRTNKSKTNYPNYYKDITCLPKEELRELLNKYNSDDNLILEQIKINSDICKKKHNFLKLGIILLVPFIAIIIALIFMIIFA